MKTKTPIVILVGLLLLGMIAVAPGLAQADTSAPVLDAKVIRKGAGGVQLHWKYETDAKQKDRTIEVQSFVEDGVDQKWETILTLNGTGKNGSRSDKDPLVHTTRYRARIIVATTGGWGPELTVEPVADPTTTPPTTTQPITTPTTTPPNGVTACPAEWDVQVRNAVNALRVAGGVAPLKDDGPLDNAANARATTMANNRNMAHGNWVAEVTAFYPYWGALAENIHAVVAVDRVVTDWKNSAGHNVNMMNATYNDVGVGCMYGSNGVIFWALELGWNGANA